MGLFDIFKSKKQAERLNTEPAFEEPTIFYHEDDFRQVEIIPNDNLKTLVADSEKVDSFAKEHLEGSGFTDIYVRSDKNKTELSQRQIHPNELEIILGSLSFNRIQNVFTGYGQSYRELHRNCIGFGKIGLPTLH